MNIYNQALEQIFNQLTQVKEELNKKYGYDVINNITKRIKTPNSIVNKMKKKNCEMNYRSLIKDIHDIAGIRIICPIKSNISTIIDIINKMPNVKVLKEKDYISSPKKSGYSGYHMIVETPVNIEGQQIYVKVEIQLRTMAMDFWATNEHKIKYKTNKKLSIFDSAKLTIYAKLLNILDDRIMKMYQKQEKLVI